MSTQVVTYAVDASTRVGFEIEPPPGFRPAGSAQDVIGQIQEAVTPAVEAAKTVLDKVREASPDKVEVRFGVKVSGGVSWLVAKAAGEGNFDITLTWDRRSASARTDGQDAGGPADVLDDDSDEKPSLTDGNAEAVT